MDAFLLKEHFRLATRNKAASSRVKFAFKWKIWGQSEKWEIFNSFYIEHKKQILGIHCLLQPACFYYLVKSRFVIFIFCKLGIKSFKDHSFGPHKSTYLLQGQTNQHKTCLVLIRCWRKERAMMLRNWILFLSVCFSIDIGIFWRNWENTMWRDHLKSASNHLWIWIGISLGPATPFHQV